MTAVLSPGEALRPEVTWDGVDVVIVDAFDEREAFDRFPGVAVVEAIRRRRSPDETLVVVISGHVLNELLRLRMAEAGADFFYGHAEVRDLPTLVEVIQQPDAGRRVDPVPEAEGVNAALRHVEEAGIAAAFEPGQTQRAASLSRRTVINARRRVGEMTGLGAAPDTGGRDRRRRMPEWKALVRFVNRARGIDSDDSGGRP